MSPGLWPERDWDAALGIRDTLVEGRVELVAPALLVTDVANAIWKKWRLRGKPTDQGAHAARPAAAVQLVGGVVMPAIELHEVVGAWPTGRAGLFLLFEDGPRVADLSTLAEKGGLFAALRDPAFFRQVRVDPEAGTVVWPNGLDLAPEVLHEQSEPVPEDMFEPLLARARRRTLS